MANKKASDSFLHESVFGEGGVQFTQECVDQYNGQQRVTGGTEFTGTTPEVSFADVKASYEGLTTEDLTQSVAPAVAPTQMRPH